MRLASANAVAAASLIALVGVALLFAAFFKWVARPAFVVITLVIGLSWSLGFTALTIGHQNIFTIIFIIRVASYDTLVRKIKEELAHASS
jgi:hypothetical protein